MFGLSRLLDNPCVVVAYMLRRVYITASDYNTPQIILL